MFRRRQLETALHVRAMIDANIQAFALKLTCGFRLNGTVISASHGQAFR